MFITLDYISSRRRFAPGMHSFARLNCRRVTGAIQLLQSDNTQLLQHKAHKKSSSLTFPLTPSPATLLIHCIVNAILFGGVLLYGSLRGLIDSWHKGPGCFVSCCTECDKCCLDIAMSLGRQIKLWTPVLVLLGISKLGSSAERFVVPIASNLGPDSTNDVSRDGRAPVCGHPLQALVWGSEHPSTHPGTFP